MKINTTQYDYTYDKLYQLIDADYPGGSAAYGYDKLGVRTSMADGSTTTYRTNNLNQLLSSCTEDCITLYDDNGNLYAWNQVGLPIYEYDCENHLTRALVSGSMDIRYKYDYLGRRVKRAQGSSTIKYVYDGDQIVAEYDNSGNLIRKYVYGAGIDEPAMMITSGGTKYYYHYDALGSVTALTDNSGDVVETYAYDPYGHPSNTSSVGNPYLFTGRSYDSDSGLYYYRARDYSPQLGVFLQPDPVMEYMQIATAGHATRGKVPGQYLSGEALQRHLQKDPIGRFLANDPAGRFLLLQSYGIPSELNLYTYCGNNPVTYIDPYGQFGLAGGAVGAAVGGVVGGLSGGWSGAWKGAVSGFVGGFIGGPLGGMAGAALNQALNGQVPGTSFGKFLSLAAGGIGGAFGPAGAGFMAGIAGTMAEKLDEVAEAVENLQDQRCK